MYLEQSEMSCGIDILTDVGENPNDDIFKETMAEIYGGMVLASVPLTWTKAVRFLKKKGFKQVGKGFKNPTHPENKRNIALFYKKVSKSERKKFKAYKPRDDYGYY